MHYIAYVPGGAPGTLTLQQGPAPTLHPGEVLIEVAFAGVNRPDVLQRQGVYPPPSDASPILGLEISGRVAAAAPGVEQPRVGDLVCALTPGGGYAEQCVVPASHCLPLPGGLGLLEAAAIPENYFTVWSNVFERGRLGAGQTLLVHGGSSGIGLTAIQLAKAFGATVLTTVGSEAKAEAVKRAGADHAILYRQADFVAAVRERTGGRGADVILDMVGGGYLNRNLRSLAVDGRLVQIGTMESASATIELGLILQRRLTLTGSALRPRSLAEKAVLAEAVQKNIWPLLAAGRCRPWIDRVCPLAAAAEAHARMETSEHIGKLMLQVMGSGCQM